MQPRHSLYTATPQLVYSHAIAGATNQRSQKPTELSLQYFISPRHNHFKKAVRVSTVLPFFRNNEQTSLNCWSDLVKSTTRWYIVDWRTSWLKGGAWERRGCGLGLGEASDGCVDVSGRKTQTSHLITLTHLVLIPSSTAQYIVLD